MAGDFMSAFDAVIAASQRYDEFTTDDVWPLMDHEPLERNVVGKAFSEACRRGLIVGTERFIRSSRPEAKGRRVQVWTLAHKPADTSLF